ncbi:lipoate--protein ligase family protein [Desulfosporosinus metallidurans]|uniref:Lipoate-protein ligase A n=1 Tax=Desulfosporosinus metallidurans TaxID=1888891 RepID=A0A1Q8QZF5_9FIRM|nr:lipoate--protein ligase family protein [Desulfosporosinus metallidurans]OLN32733.1 Lipoate-protein ligase A [Desulfosporosinus metallidurans]
MEKWRLLDTGKATAEENMAIDESLLISHARGLSLPTIRFYSWSPSAISLGSSQKLEEIDRVACRANGVDVVKRITGGRAVFHDDELTYSLVAAEDNQRISGSITESYHKISSGLYEGFKKLGADVEMARRPEKHAQNSAVCFDAPSWYEIVWQGKKVAGNAQTRRKNVILQHGSIPLSMDIDKFVKLLNVKAENQREILSQSLKKKACGLDQVLKRKVTYAELKEALITSMEEQLQIILTPMTLTAQELEIARNLITENKYSLK